MTAEAFITALQALAPSREALANSGYSSEDAELFRKSFVAVKRSRALGIDTHGDALLELIDGWDISPIRIGPLSFHAVPRGTPTNIEVGQLEADPLVFAVGDREYRLLDHEVKNRVLCNAASNGSAILAGLVTVASYYAKTATDEYRLEDEQVAEGIKRECVSQLGGDKYAVFCTALIGV